MKAVCWLRGIWDTIRLGTWLMGARVSGHRYVERGERLVCDVCGDDRWERERFDVGR
jgi:hypothetical protein